MQFFIRSDQMIFNTIFSSEMWIFCVFELRIVSIDVRFGWWFNTYVLYIYIFLFSLHFKL